MTFPWVKQIKVDDPVRGLPCGDRGVRLAYTLINGRHVDARELSEIAWRHPVAQPALVGDCLYVVADDAFYCIRTWES